MALTLHGYWRSSASYRVRIALNLKQLAYQYEPVHLVKEGGKQHQAAYRRLNPSALVPTLVDEQAGVKLNQSLAIIEYLEECYPDTLPLLPTDPYQRAQVRTMALDIACDIQPLANLRVMQYLKNEAAVNPMVQQAWPLHWMHIGFQAFEQRLQQSAGTYCHGDQLSLADVCLVPQVYNALRIGLPLTDFPLLQGIAQRCNTLAAFIAAKPENQSDAEL
jgi:maleylacetoacetate isomerase